MSNEEEDPPLLPTICVLIVLLEIIVYTKILLQEYNNKR